MYYFIVGYSSAYGTYHGMYDFDLVKCSNYNDACDTGAEMSREVIESYRPEDIIYTEEDFLDEFGYDEWDDSYRDEYYEVLDEAIEDNIEYMIFLVKDQENAEENYKNWLKDNLDFEDFIKKYCVRPPEENI